MAKKTTTSYSGVNNGLNVGTNDRYVGSLDDKYFSTTPVGVNNGLAPKSDDRYMGGLDDKYISPTTFASGAAAQSVKGNSAPVNNTEAGNKIWNSMGAYGTNVKKQSAADLGLNNTTKTTTTGSGSGSGAGTYASLLSAYLNNAQNYAQAQLNAQRAAAQSAYDNSMNALNNAYNSQINNLRGNYDSTVNQLNASYDNSANKINSNAENSLREAYINKMLSQKNLGQQMSALGLNGGATESTLASLLNNYGNSRNNIETTKASNLSDLAYTLNNNLASALQEYNSAVANADNARASQIMNLENALANNQISAVSDYYSMLNNNNDNYMSLLKSLISNMKGYSITPTEATNLVNSVNTTQASNNPTSNYAKLAQALTGSDSSNATSSASGVDTMANANLLAELLK